jgi:DNA-binding CsgD family transcriptional regulator
MMHSQLQQRCIAVLHSRSVEEFLRLNVEFVQSLGFHTVAATVITDHSPQLTAFQSVTNAPSDYMPLFYDMASAKLDPVSQHCKKLSTPIVWNQAIYAEHGRGDFWEHQAPFGYRSGISVALHLPHGKHFMFGVDSDRDICIPKGQRQNLLSDLCHFAAHSQAAAFDFCIPYQQPDDILLPDTELDALRRSMDGLTNWDIGCAMGISETEVLLRLRRAMQRLGCTNKYEAGLRAIRLGLVHCD